MKKYDLYSKRDPAKNFSPLPNEVFYLGLSYCIHRTSSSICTEF